MKLIEKILDKSNVRTALERVIANKGGAGIDGMRVEELRDYMNANWATLKQSILERSYKPAPVRRVEIPKPNGGVRKARHTNGSRPHAPTSNSTSAHTNFRRRISRKQLRLPPGQKLRASSIEAIRVPK